MKLFKRFIQILIITSLFLFTACSPKTSERNRKTPENGVIDKNIDPVILKSFEQQHLEKLNKLLLEVESIFNKEAQLEDEKIDQNLLFERIIKPLSPYLLDVNFMINPYARSLRANSGIRLLPRLVQIFNYSFIKLYRLQPNSSRNKKVLYAIKDLLFYGCNDELRGACTMLKYYKIVDSSQTTKIVKFLFEIEKDELQREKLLYTAFELKNRRLDDSLRFMFLQRVSKSLELKNRNKITQDRLRRDAYLFANILKIDLLNQDKTDRYAEVIRKLNPWLLSRKIEDPKRPAMADLLKLAGAHLMYDSHGKLTDEFYAAIKSQMYRVNLEELGIKFQVNNIKGEWHRLISDGEAFILTKPLKQRDFYRNLLEEIKANPILELNRSIYSGDSARILDNFLKDSDKYGKSQTTSGPKEGDEYDYLVYQLYHGHFEIEDASSIWNYTKKDRARLIDAANHLIKMQIIDRIVFTATRINDFYSRGRAFGLVELIRLLDVEDQEINREWARVISQSDKLKRFISRTTKQSSPAIRAKFLDFQIIVEAIDKNVKFLATYPNMFPLLHFITEKQLNQTINTWFGDWVIDHTTITHKFFSGLENPWFELSNEVTKLTAPEIIYTFQYALMTQLFDTYKTNTFIEFSDEAFFRQVVRRLLFGPEEDLKRERTSYITDQNAFSNNMDLVNRVCDQEKLHREEEDQALNDLFERASNDPKFEWYKHFNDTLKSRENIKIPVFFGNIKTTSPFHFNDSRENTIGKGIQEVFKESMVIRLRKIRTEIFNEAEATAKYNLRVPFILGDLFKQHYPDREVEIQNILDSELASYEKEKALFLKTFVQQYEKIDDCLNLFYKRDRDIRYAILFEEMQFLDRLFEALYKKLGTSAQRAKITATTLSELNAIKIQFSKEYTQNSAYPKDFVDKYGHWDITPGGVIQYPLDIMARIRMHIKNIFDDDFEFEEEANYNIVSYATKSDDESITFRWHLPKEEAKKHFIQSGIRAVFSQLNWLGKAPSLSNLTKKGTTINELFKMGLINLDHTKDCDKLKPSSQDFSINCRKITASEIIDHHKNLLDALNIDLLDKYVMDQLGTDEKYNRSTYHDFIKYKGEPRLYAPYDLLFHDLMFDVHFKVTQDIWFQNMITEYTKAAKRIRKKDLIFPVADYVHPVTQKYYKSWLDDYFNFSRDFLQEIRLRLNEEKYSPKEEYSYQKAEFIDLYDIHDGPLGPLLSKVMYDTKFKDLVRNLRTDIQLDFGEVIDNHMEEIQKIIDGESPSPSGD